MKFIQLICRVIILVSVSMQAEEFHQYVIIGAGISGLQAAIILSQHQKDFIILEATSVLGGRIGTQTLGQILQKQNINSSFGIKQDQPQWINQKKDLLNIPVQYGATWVAESHSFMKRLIKELKLDLFPQFKNGSFIYGVKPGQYQSLKSFTQLYDKQTKQKIQQLLNKIQKLKNKFQKLYEQAIQKEYYDKIQVYKNFINKYDTLSLADYIRQELKDQELANSIMNFIQCLQCISCDKSSMMQLIDDDDSLEIVQETVYDGGESDDGYRVKSGMLSIIKGMFQKIIKNISLYKQNAIQKDIIKYNQPVIKIETWQNKNKKLSKIHTKGGKTYSAKKILNSIPLATLSKVQITNLSIGKKLFFNGQEMGNVYRVYMVFKQPFWRNKFNGYGSFGPKFPFNQLTDISPANNQCGVLVFVFYVDKYHKWIQSNPDALQRFNFLRRVVADMMLNGDQNSEYLKDCYTFVRTFDNHEYIKAAYQTTTKMGVWKAIQEAGDEYGSVYERDQNGVYYISSQFDEDYGSYMEGAVRIARKKTYRLLSKPDPWKK